MYRNRLRDAFLASTVLAGLSVTAAPAFAQDTRIASAAPETKDDTAGIIVTGTMFRRIDKELVSPVTTLTADDLDKRGIQTVQAAIQTISSNNAPALTNGFTANGAFAGGASAVSLRA
jgi:iron complex outermembrane receptor protein